MGPIPILSFVLAVLPSFADARPYYAAKKGISCAACHIAPAGGGVRKVHDESPFKFSDAVALGADLRAFFAQTEATDVSSFRVGRSALSVLAQPLPPVKLVYQHHVDLNQMAQAYGMWSFKGALPAYVRAGRFWLPYGIQWDDPDDTLKLHQAPFAPSVGFDMSPSQSDMGVEVGLAPNKHYFANLAVTNGRFSGLPDNDEGKALTARAGFIHKRFMIGATLYRNRTGPAGTDYLAVRYGPLAWVGFGPAALVYEGGFGEDRPNSGAAHTRMVGHAAELTLEPLDGWLGKTRFDSFDPNKSVKGDHAQRWTLGIERLLDGAALEVLYRLNSEPLSLPNNQFLLHGHLWF